MFGLLKLCCQWRLFVKHLMLTVLTGSTLCVQVSAYVRTRTVDEVLEMVKHGLKAARFAPNQNGYQIAKKRQVAAGHCPMNGSAQIASVHSKHAAYGRELVQDILPVTRWPNTSRRLC